MRRSKDLSRLNDSLLKDVYRLIEKHPKIAADIERLEELPSFNEGGDVVTGIELAAYDAGAEGIKSLPSWFKRVARVLKVDVESLRKGGAEDAGINESSHFNGEKSMRIEELNLALADIEAALLETTYSSSVGNPEAGPQEFMVMDEDSCNCEDEDDCDCDDKDDDDEDDDDDDEDDD